MPLSTIAMPSNFGVWAGPSYAGGQIISDKKNNSDPATFTRLYSLESGVRSVGYLDAAARSHDMAYEYAVRMYGKDGVDPNSSMQKNVQFLADLDLMVNALQYRPADDDFIGKHYRQMVISGFYFQAVQTYDMGAHMTRIWNDYLQVFDPGYEEPNISDMPIFGKLGLVLMLPDAHLSFAWRTLGLEHLTTSDFLSDLQREDNLGLSQQEMLMFNRHLNGQKPIRNLADGTFSAEWEYGGELNTKAFGNTDMAMRLVIPKYDLATNALVYRGHLNGRTINISLDLNTDTFRTFTWDDGVTRETWFPEKSGNNTDLTPLNAAGYRNYTKTVETWNAAENKWDNPFSLPVVAIDQPALRQTLTPVQRWEDRVINATYANDGNIALDQLAFNTLFTKYATPSGIL